MSRPAPAAPFLETTVLTALAARYGRVVEADDRVAAHAGERAWLRISETPAYDVWLITWGPGSALGWHDHDGSAGAFSVLRGALEETYADTDTIAPVVTRTLGAGATVAVPATRVHAVENASGSEAVTVHVYSPPLGEWPTMRS